MGAISASKTVEIVENSKKGITSFTTVTLAVILVLMYGAVRPTVLTIVRISSEIAQKKDIAEALDMKINVLADLRQEYNNEVQEKVSDLALVYPARGDFSLVMANLENVCEKNGFELVSIGFGSVDRDEKVVKGLEVLEVWKATITVEGPQSSLVPLMEEIESFPMYPVIKSVAFSTDTDDHGNNVISISVEMYKVGDHDFYYSN